MIGVGGLRRRPVPVDRSADRRVVVVAIGLAAGFLLASIGSLFLPADVRHGVWLPIHLGLAGGASTAISGVMPFFSAAFAAAPPSDVRLRSLAVAAVAFGALAVVGGVIGTAANLAVIGGGTFIAGIAATGWATVRPLRAALGPSRGLVSVAYVVALGELAVGATTATLFLAGWPAVAGAWARLVPAHAWLNLVGFVSLVIATTLLHFFPTVIGARIVAARSARVTVLGLAIGAPSVAFGFAFAADLVARAGAIVTIVGALGLVTYARRVWRTRARWTTDPAWHRFAIGGLISAIAWFVAGVGVAAGRVLALGADPAGWSVGTVIAPIAFGWAGMAVLASATHLVPAIGPGDPLNHGRQRALLGRLAIARLAALDLGVAALSTGLPLGSDALTTAGAIALVGGTVSTVAVILGAIAIGARAPAVRGTPGP